MKKIIDVSAWNGFINWKSIKSYGIDGAIIKIIKKDLARDAQFDANFKACNSLSLPWGVYNYTYATTPAKARSDMRLVCDILDNVDKTYFSYGVWFDIEDSLQANLSRDVISSIINAAQEVVESRGYNFGVYTGMAFYGAHIDPKKVKCSNWWIARYYKGYDTMQFKTEPNGNYKPKNAGDIMAWQYTSSGVFPKSVSTGNSGKFDLNILYKEFKAVSEPLNKKTVEVLAKEVLAGKWGSGDSRKASLKKAGYDYKTIQAAVNELIKRIAKEVIDGKWGDGSTRKANLEKEGYDYQTIQDEVNKLLK